MSSPRTRWIGLLFVSLGISLIIVDSTIINVSIPAIIEDLGITSTQVQWVQESYTLVFAALLLVFGSLADRFGRRRMMVIGMAVFTVASVFAGFAQDGNLLILARVFQGLGGAMVLPTTLSLVNANFQGKERGIAFAVWGSTIGGMVAVGPLLGGWLTTDFSWRWAFGINVPLGIIIVIGALLTVVESKEPGPARRIDWGGAVLSIVAMSTLVFGLIEGRTYGWWLVNQPFQIDTWTWPFELSIIPICFAVFIGSVVWFILHGLARSRAGKQPLVAFHLFAIPSFRNGNVAAMIISLGEFGLLLSLPLWLQFVVGYNALSTGFVRLALAAGAFLASGLAGGLGSRVPPVRMVQLGILLELIGVTGVGFAISPASGWAEVTPFLFVYGIGVGLATAQLTGVVLKDVPVAESGQASGTQSTSRQLGSALGIAVLGTVLFTSVQIQLTNTLNDQGLPADTVSSVVASVVDSSGGAILGFEKDPASAEIVVAAKQSISDGTRYAAFAAAGFLVLGFLSTLRLNGAGTAATNRASANGASSSSPSKKKK
jgi:EmrB/QacA subfamily drug resistance transporter